ncbi:MAG: hypothetical protein U1F68_05155 [Gammaproteobacteria bacterium]
MKRYAVLLLTLLAGTQTPSTAGPLPSHCDDEQVIFTCMTSKTKAVSLCASNSLTATDGYLQYRFGVLGEDPELVYPAKPEHPASHFRSGTLAFSGGGGAYLRFDNGAYTYTVFTGIGKGWEKQGVVVEKGSKRVAYLACKGDWMSELGPELFEEAAIPADDGQFEIP